MTNDTNAPERIEVSYANWKGITSTRRIIPHGIRFAATEWHPEPQWLLRAWDDDRQAWRDFALKDFDFQRTETLAREGALLERAAEVCDHAAQSRQEQIDNRREGDDLVQLQRWTAGKVQSKLNAAKIRALTTDDAAEALAARDERIRREATKAERGRIRRGVVLLMSEGKLTAEDVLAAIRAGGDDD